jgi:hypothetical protein
MTAKMQWAQTLTLRLMAEFGLTNWRFKFNRAGTIHGAVYLPSPRPTRPDRIVCRLRRAKWPF